MLFPIYRPAGSHPLASCSGCNYGGAVVIYQVVFSLQSTFIPYRWQRHQLPRLQGRKLVWAHDHTCDFFTVLLHFPQSRKVIESVHMDGLDNLRLYYSTASSNSLFIMRLYFFVGDEGKGCAMPLPDHPAYEMPRLPSPRIEAALVELRGRIQT